MKGCFWILSLVFVFCGALDLNAQEEPIRLPTANDALLRGDYEAFYMFVDRDVNGVKTTPWEGGTYGMVRGPRPWNGGTIMGHWHEGIDIQPMRRDAKGEPQDEVKSIATGQVVHASRSPRDSNYGCYVVVKHSWSGAFYYSLYAHLSSVKVTVGEMVKPGQLLGVMGHTGEGLDIRRAHLHLEITLLLNERFDDWYQSHVAGENNKHGAFNGMNLVGFDVAKWVIAQQKNPGLTVSGFLEQQEPWFAIAFPEGKPFDLLRRYPWLVKDNAKSSTGAWQIKFTQGGVPILAEPYLEKLTAPKVTYVKSEPLPVSIITKGYVTSNGGRLVLTGNGEKWIALLSGNFPGSVQ